MDVVVTDQTPKELRQGDFVFLDEINGSGRMCLVRHDNLYPLNGADVKYFASKFYSVDGILRRMQSDVATGQLNGFTIYPSKQYQMKMMRKADA